MHVATLTHFMSTNDNNNNTLEYIHCVSRTKDSCLNTLHWTARSQSRVDHRAGRASGNCAAPDLTDRPDRNVVISHVHLADCCCTPQSSLHSERTALHGYTS